MAEVNPAKTPSLVEDYLLVAKDKTPETTVKAAEEAYVKTPVNAVPEEAVEKTEATPLVVENIEVPDATSEANKESADATDGESTEPAVAAEHASQNNHAVSEETSESAQNESNDSSADQDAVDDTPEIKLETAPADFRFPTTNQSRHCFTRYVEYHRCIAAKEDDAPECQKFAKYYRSLCPGEWIDRWNEQRENGTFPGPL